MMEPLTILYYIGSAALNVLTTFTILGLMIAVHEFGHTMYFWAYLQKWHVRPRIQRTGKLYEIVVGKEEDYQNMTDPQRAVLYLCGIIPGLLPAGITILFQPLHTLLVIPVYFYWSASDIINFFGALDLTDTPLEKLE